MIRADKTGRRTFRPATRRLVQLYSALLHNAYLKGFIDGEIYSGNAKYACVPGLNCYSCPGAAGSCPLGSLQNALSSAGHRAGWYVLGILLLFGVILGRTICGWMCPMGLLQELLHKVPTLKIRKSRFTRMLSWLKYVLLAVFVTAIPLWYGLTHDIPLPAFCKYICPAGTFEGAIGHLVNPANKDMFRMLGGLFTGKFIILVLIGLACVFCYRSFCRFLCPLGAIYSLFNRFSIVGVKVDQDRCSQCGACVRSCGMDVRYVGDRECISCGKCVNVCSKEAISVRAGRIVLVSPGRGGSDGASDMRRKSRYAGRILWGAALAVLCFALLWFNVLDPAAGKKSGSDTGSVPAGMSAESEDTEGFSADAYESAAPVGHEEGQQLEDFTLTCYDGSEFHLADTRGKVTFINFWAVYCAPCIKELSYFDDLYREYKEDLAVIAIHPKLITRDPEEFLSDKGYVMPFATDTDDTVKGIAGGTDTLPQTIVLNRRGEVIYNQIGSVTPEVLLALYEEAG